MMDELFPRDRLYNILLRAIKENASGYECWLVIQVLKSVSSAVENAALSQDISKLFDCSELQELKRIPREKGEKPNA